MASVRDEPNQQLRSAAGLRNKNSSAQTSAPVPVAVPIPVNKPNTRSRNRTLRLVRKSAPYSDPVAEDKGLAKEQYSPGFKKSSPRPKPKGNISPKRKGRNTGVKTQSKTKAGKSVSGDTSSANSSASASKKAKTTPRKVKKMSPQKSPSVQESNPNSQNSSPIARDDEMEEPVKPVKLVEPVNQPVNVLPGLPSPGDGTNAAITLPKDSMDKTDEDSETMSLDNSVQLLNDSLNSSSPSSSPIHKHAEPQMQTLAAHQLPPPLPQFKRPLPPLLSDPASPSTPSKSRKTVGFSDEIDILSSPQHMSSPTKSSRIRQLKSILKPLQNPECDHASNSPISRDKIHWVSGSIVQLPVGSLDNVHFLEKTHRDLMEPGFKHQFEAYTSLNIMIKTNSQAHYVEWFKNYFLDLFDCIRRDVSQDPDYADPFFARTAIQLFKLAMNFFDTLPFTSQLPVESTREFIIFCSALIQKPEISKGVAAVLLQLLRDQQLPHRIISPKVGEYILQLILSMKTFSSTSVVIERINTLKEYVKNHTTMMVKNINVWLPFLFINLTDTVSVLYLRILKAGAQFLALLCRLGLGNKAVSFALYNLLDQKLSLAFKDTCSQSTQSQLDQDIVVQDPKLLQYFCSKLAKLIDLGHSVVSMDIWFHTTMLLARAQKEGSFENWSGLQSWIAIFDKSFNHKIQTGDSYDDQAPESDPRSSSRILAIKAWAAVAYSCVHDIDTNLDLRKEQSRLILLVHPFSKCNASLSMEESKALHCLSVKILYALVNSISFYHKTSHTPYDQLWTHVIMPILDGFYFNKAMDPRLCSVREGASILISLLDSARVNSDKRIDITKFFPSEQISVQELTHLPSRWISLNHSSFHKYLLESFKSSSLEDGKKLELFNSYVNGLRLSSSRELKQNGKLADIASGIPLLVATLFQNLKTVDSVGFIYDLVIKLNDALGFSALIDDSDTARNSCNSIITRIVANKNHSVPNLVVLCKFISNTLGYRLQLPFYQDLFEIGHEPLRNFVLDRINDRKFLKISIADYLYMARIFHLSKPGEINRSVIASLMNYVLNPIVEKHPAKAIELLRIDQWNNQLFEEAITQLIELRSKYATARNAHMQEILKFLVSCRLSLTLGGNNNANGSVDDALEFLTNFCSYNDRKMEVLKFSLMINKWMKQVFAQEPTRRPLLQMVSMRILGLFEGDEFGTNTFEELKPISDWEESVLLPENGTLSNTVDPDVIPSLEKITERQSSPELIMEYDDSEMTQESQVENNPELDSISTGQSDELPNIDEELSGSEQDKENENPFDEKESSEVSNVQDCNVDQLDRSSILKEEVVNRKVFSKRSLDLGTVTSEDKTPNKIQKTSVDFQKQLCEPVDEILSSETQNLVVETVLDDKNLSLMVQSLLEEVDKQNKIMTDAERNQIEDQLLKLIMKLRNIQQVA